MFELREIFLFVVYLKFTLVELSKTDYSWNIERLPFLVPIVERKLHISSCDAKISHEIFCDVFKLSINKHEGIKVLNYLRLKCKSTT